MEIPKVGNIHVAISVQSNRNKLVGHLLLDPIVRPKYNVSEKLVYKNNRFMSIQDN